MLFNRLVPAALLLGIVAPCVHGAPCAGFTDVDTTSAFCVNVEWIKNRNITLGCTATRYCPNDPVTRLQMAAFLNRLGNVTFQQGGNAFGATAIVGTTDDRALQIWVNGRRAMYIEPRLAASGNELVNIVGGIDGAALVGVYGGTVGGGGAPGSSSPLGDPCPHPFQCSNVVADHFSTIGGGIGNLAGEPDASPVTDRGATISGGVGNHARRLAFVGGGLRNSATGVESVATGGGINTAAGDDSTVGGGFSNHASGAYSTIPGGLSNVAAGEGSFAAGTFAQSLANGCFTWADSNAATYQCTGANAFTARASGGVYFRTNPTATAGVDLFGGASAWSPLSDRAMKENVALVNTGDVLERLVRVPIATWNYVSQDRSIRHVGPMAQDFALAFGVGESDRHISTIDADGIALAAIQGLNAKLEAEVVALRAELAQIRALVAQRLLGTAQAP